MRRRPYRLGRILDVLVYLLVLLGSFLLVSDPQPQIFNFGVQRLDVRCHFVVFNRVSVKGLDLAVVIAIFNGTLLEEVANHV